jgi:hypothetical protein
MSRFSFFAGACVLASVTACAHLDTGGASGARPMFNGRDFTGWELVTMPAVPLADAFSVRPDGVIASAGKPIGFLASTQTYRNFRMHVEWRWPHEPGNGGVLLHIASGPKDREWPLSLQVQTKHGNVGDLLPMAGASFAEPLTSAPGTTPTRARLGADSEKPAGQWNACDIVARDGTIEVWVNGVLQNKATKVEPSGGKVGFQLEGTPYELRNVTIELLITAPASSQP